MTAPRNYQIDDELLPILNEILAQFPGGFNSPASVLERRQLISSYLSTFPKNQNVDRIDYLLENFPEDSCIPIRIYRPKFKEVNTGLIFAIHGGGMVMGGIEEDDGNAAWLSEQLSTTVIAIDYRLAPEHPFPAALNDCFHVARWLLDSPEELIKLLPDDSEIDFLRAVIYGGSAGGNLALATAIKLLHEGHKNFQLIVAPYPMLDYQNLTPSTQEITDLGIWDRLANIQSWNWYLSGGSTSERSHPDQLASPAHATNLAGLPPVFLDVGGSDLFRDEVLEFVRKLSSSKISLEFHLYPGAFHASELFAPQARLSKKIWANRFTAVSNVIDKNPRSANFWLE